MSQRWFSLTSKKDPPPEAQSSSTPRDQLQPSHSMIVKLAGFSNDALSYREQNREIDYLAASAAQLGPQALVLLNDREETIITTEVRIALLAAEDRLRGAERQRATDLHETLERTVRALASLELLMDAQKGLKPLEEQTKQSLETMLTTEYQAAMGDQRSPEAAPKPRSGVQRRESFGLCRPEQMAQARKQGRAPFHSPPPNQRTESGSSSDSDSEEWEVADCKGGRVFSIKKLLDPRKASQHRQALQQHLIKVLRRLATMLPLQRKGVDCITRVIEGLQSHQRQRQSLGQPEAAVCPKLRPPEKALIAMEEELILPAEAQMKMLHAASGLGPSQSALFFDAVTKLTELIRVDALLTIADGIINGSHKFQDICWEGSQALGEVLVYKLGILVHQIISEAEEGNREAQNLDARYCLEDLCVMSSRDLFGAQGLCSNVAHRSRINGLLRRYGGVIRALKLAVVRKLAVMSQMDELCDELLLGSVNTGKSKDLDTPDCSHADRFGSLSSTPTAAPSESDQSVDSSRSVRRFFRQDLTAQS